MIAHDCTTHDPTCPRCDLSRAEVEDDFTEAAREAADEYDDAWFEDDYGYVAFELGAQWARTHLAAQEPPDVEVEAAAGAMYRNPEGWASMLTLYKRMVAEGNPRARGHAVGHRLDLAREGLCAARAARRDEATR